MDRLLDLLEVLQLALDGAETLVSWRSETGEERSTNYEIPSEVACVTCHQRDREVDLIGLRPRNLNIDVLRDGGEVNQLEDLRARDLVSGAQSVSSIPVYEDASNDLEARARAYLDANCAHCHNPDAWKRSARTKLDLRYETPLADTGLLNERKDFAGMLIDGEMPFIGTTIIDDEGVDLVLRYLETL